MVLEETLLFNSAEDADTFIKFLRKKRCKAHKRSTAVFLEIQEISGPFNKVIDYLEELAEDAELDDDEFEEGFPFDERIDDLERQKEMLDNFLLSHEEGDIVFSADDIEEYSKTATLHMMQSVLPIFKEKMAELGHELPTPQDERKEISEEEAGKARNLLAVFDLLEENNMIDKEGDFYRLTKKLPLAECITKVNLSRLPEIDPDDLSRYGLLSHVNLIGQVQHQVFMDSDVNFQFSVDEIDEGLIGLDVDAGSLDAFYRSLERKQIAIHAILEVVGQAGKISLDALCERLQEYAIHGEESTGSISLTLEQDFLSPLVTELRKLGYLAGSQETIRLGKG